MSTTTSIQPIQLTEGAVSQLKRIMEEQQVPESYGLRVGVKGGGCSGFQYKFAVETQPAEDDLKIARDGVTVLVDPVSVDLIKGATLDFVDDLMGRSFRVENPNATASCGCGTSFSI